MPRIPSVSPATGFPTSDSFIHTTDCNFVDSNGRTLLLRGINLSGSSKAPPDRPSYCSEDFWEVAESGGESFIGRPLNIDDGTADVHLARLRGWGFNMLRFPVTWEALEHEGPGKYDYEFMDYTVRVLRKCKQYGFKVYMDPHQDIWSRFSGGSGAPFWTLAACGINPRNFTATQSAIVHCEYPLAHDADPGSLPAMIWSTNYGRLASQTLFTLFFAGNDFAPRCIIDDQNIQDWLQDRFIAAFGQLADRIRDAGDLFDDCVIGWDSMNEPFEGLVGYPDLNMNPAKQGSTLRKGTCPTPAQSLRLGMGQPQTVENWTFGTFGPARDGSVTIDPAGRTIWATREQLQEDSTGFNKRWGWRRDPIWKLGTCIWALHGVWDIETGFILRPDYFRYLPPEEDAPQELEEAEFIEDHWKPHWQAYSTRIRMSHPEAILFVQPPVFAIPPRLEELDLKGRCAYSGHYYDGLTLITRHWNWFNADALGLLRGKYKRTLAAVKFGESAIRRSLQEQLAILKSDTEILGPYPTLIGEIGTPFDMDNKRSYGWTDNGKHLGDYSNQEKALDASLNGADGFNAINWTIWTYCTDSTHEWGDGWNMEDLSLWSADDLAMFSGGGGALGGSSPSQATMDGGSKAVLLARDGKMKMALSRSTAGSEMSLVTLNNLNGVTLTGEESTTMMSSTTPTAANSPPRISGKVIAGYHENPFDFLTDGARAVRAFCRPWPEKLVGRSVDIKFDLKKAEFRMVVRVRAEDRPCRGGGKDAGGANGDGNGEGEGEEIATEIFVPLVHFAHERLLIGTPGNSGRSSEEQQQGTTATKDHQRQQSKGQKQNFMDDSPPVTSSSRNSSTLNLDEMTSSVSTSRTYAGTANTGSHHHSNDKKPAYNNNSACDSDPPKLLRNIADKDDLLDLDVVVSSGRWAVEKGQILKWWYDVPKEGEPDREYSILIKRRGGVIRSKDLVRMRGGGMMQTWTERLCPKEGGCVVM